MTDQPRNFADPTLVGEKARHTRRAFIAGLAVAAAPLKLAAAPSSRMIDAAWRQSGSGGDPDHAPWAAFLDEWSIMGADGVVLVDYAGAKTAGADDRLAVWLKQTQATDPTSLRPEAAMAWWINLYNAKTVDLIFGDYPVGSIKEVMGGLFNTGPWDEKVLRVNGSALSLNDVEHGILRPVWGDNRIHYAVNCASIGCPNLKRTPWAAATLEPDLDAAARAYVNHPRGASLDNGRLTVSKIYDWYQDDFGGSEEGVIAHLKAYADASFAEALKGVDEVHDTVYDWSLNQT